MAFSLKQYSIPLVNCFNGKPIGTIKTVKNRKIPIKTVYELEKSPFLVGNSTIIGDFL